MKVRNLSLAAMLIALGVVTSHVVVIPVGAAKVFPMQHAINVIAAVYLGPLGAGLVAFLVAALRNMLGVGTLLAFPGGMVGAVLAGALYQRHRKAIYAVAGEVIGTGLLGALLSYPVAIFLLGRAVLAYAYIIPFSISSVGGAIIGFLVVRAIAATGNLPRVE